MTIEKMCLCHRLLISSSRSKGQNSNPNFVVLNADKLVTESCLKGANKSRAKSNLKRHANKDSYT